MDQKYGFRSDARRPKTAMLVFYRDRGVGRAQHPKTEMLASYGDTGSGGSTSHQKTPIFTPSLTKWFLIVNVHWHGTTLHMKVLSRLESSTYKLQISSK